MQLTVVDLPLQAFHVRWARVILKLKSTTSPSSLFSSKKTAVSVRTRTVWPMLESATDLKPNLLLPDPIGH